METAFRPEDWRDSYSKDDPYPIENINHNNKEKNDNNIKENLILLDSNEDINKNLGYQEEIKEKFNILFYKKTEDCISQLKTLAFEKTFILVSDSLSQEFFSGLEMVINELKICPEIIVFVNYNNLQPIKKIEIILEKYPLFNIKLVFNEFIKVKNKLLLNKEYKPNYKDIIIPDYHNCFTFDYISKSNELILPLKYTEYLGDIPNKSEILEFNKFLLEKYNKEELKELIEQLLIDIKIPFEILIKYWFRAYTIESQFYKELNFILTNELNDDFNIYVKVLYYGLINKVIKPFIADTLYRGSKIKLEELNHIKNALANKKINLPGCICYNKSFFSTSLDKNMAMSFMNKVEKDEMKVLYIIQKKDELDKESATCIDIQDYSVFKEKEILFLPFSCFEIININENNEFCEINLSYIGKYKKQVDTSEKIPENNFAKNILSANILQNIEMNKDSNKLKFDFNIEKYIQPKEKKSCIIAIYDINKDDINKKIKIINWDENINKGEIKNICNIYLNGKKLNSNFDYIFSEPGKYTFNIEFNDLLKNANKLFYGCSSLISLDFSKFKSNYIKDMTDMFNGCTKLEKIDFSNFKTKDVVSMKGTFKGCYSLKRLDLSDFDTKNVIDISEMFRECISLEYLNFLNIKNEKIKYFDKIFYLCNPFLYINISNNSNHNIDDITDKLFYNFGQNEIFDLSELESKYIDLNSEAINYISKNRFLEALTCCENSYSIAEILKDNIKIRESECNASIIYFYLNNKIIGYNLLKNYYDYFNDIYNKSKNKFKILTLLCESGAYLCISKILLLQDKEGCINLIKDIIKIISLEENNNKIFYIKYLNNIIFNGIILFLSNSSDNIKIQDKNNIIDLDNISNDNNIEYYNSFFDYMETGNIGSWIYFLEIIYQKIKEFNDETGMVNLSFHKLMAICIKYMNDNLENNISNNDNEINEAKLRLLSFIKNSYSNFIEDEHSIEEKNIDKIICEYNIKLIIIKEIYEIVNNFEKNLFINIISENYLNKLYINFPNKKDDNYIIISEYFIELLLKYTIYFDKNMKFSTHKSNTTKLINNINIQKTINEINNPKISSLILSTIDFSFIDPGIINNLYNILNFIYIIQKKKLKYYFKKIKSFKRKSMILIKTENTSNDLDKLDIFFGKAYSHICKGEIILKINFKKEGSIKYFYQLDVKNCLLKYFVNKKSNKPKDKFDLNKIKKVKIGKKTDNVIKKLNSINLTNISESKYYRFMSLIIITAKKKEKTIDLVFENTKDAKYWFYGFYYYYTYVNKKPEKIYSCTKYIFDRVKAKIVAKLKYDDEQSKKKSFVYLIKKLFDKKKEKAKQKNQKYKAKDN